MFKFKVIFWKESSCSANERDFKSFNEALEYLEKCLEKCREESDWNGGKIFAGDRCIYTIADDTTAYYDPAEIEKFR